MACCSEQVLDAVGQSLTLLEELQSSCSLASVEGYVPQVSCYCGTIQRIICSYQLGRDPCDLDLLIYQVAKLLRILTTVACCSEQVLDAVGQSLTLLEELQSSCSLASVEGYVPQVSSGNIRGRPRLNVTKEQIEYLLHLGFSCPKLADVIGVSLSTIRRRMEEYGLSVHALYSTISDRELDRLAEQIKKDFPNCGYRMMQGHLLRQGHRIPHARVRNCLHRIDSDGVAIRWATTVQR